MRLGGRQASADFAETFGRLLDAAGLSPDKLVRELKKQGQPVLVERATVYDWKGGQHLPGDEATFKAVVRVCLQQARRHGARPPLADEASWVELLREARLSRESSRSLGPRAAHGERQGSAARAASDWDPVALGVHKAIGGNPLPAFVRRPHDDFLDAALDPDVGARSCCAAGHQRANPAAHTTLYAEGRWRPGGWNTPQSRPNWLAFWRKESRREQ